MANTNPGGVDLNISPYFDDYDEDKKFVRVLYVPGRAVQARELTQAQSLQQDQIRRFAEYFFKPGAIIEGCEQFVDLSMNYVKLQSTYDGSEVDVDDFEDQIVFGANTGLKAFCGIVSDVDGTDPKSLFINYLSSGSIVLTVNNASSTLTPGNTITFSTGNTATIEASYIDPISSINKILVSNAIGTLTTTTANTVSNTGTVVTVLVSNVSDKRANTTFDNSETIFTANVDTRAYALSASTRATSTIVNQGLATEKTYTKGSKVTVKEGILYIADHFVKHSTQTLILDKYTNEPSYVVGIVPSKSFVDYIEDGSLVDNAQGTPNFQAPGADRFKIDTVLTKVGLGETTDETEFNTLLEIEDGVIRKRKYATPENKLEEVLAKRTFEESGNYVISDPKVIVREHLTIDSNGGRYSAAEGGNTQLLLLQVDPFTAYVSGIRNETLVDALIPIDKGLTTEFDEQVSFETNYQQYVTVNELVGSWDFMEGTKVDLYNTPQQTITNDGYSSLASPVGTKVGEARVRAIEYNSGVQGTASATYRLYLYEIVMTSGTFSQVRSIYDSATVKRYADIVLDANGNAKLESPSFNTLVFKLPYEAIQTIRDDQGNIETQFRFKKTYGRDTTITFNSGIATFSTATNEQFAGSIGFLNDTQKNENFMVVVTNSGANAETTTLSGTVTISSACTAVVGTSTSFNSELNVGDIIKVNGEEIQIASITNDTNLVLASAHSAGAVANTYTKILPAGMPLSLTSNGGDGSKRTVELLSLGTVRIDVKEDATFTAEIIATTDRTNAREKRKTLVFQATANVNPSTHPNGLAGPFALGYGDIYRLHAVYQSANFSTPATTSDTNVTSNYTLNNGQRDYAYEYGTVTPKTGVTPTGRLLVVFDHFTHDTTQGVGYCSVDSYPVNDTTVANTTITTAQIPTFVSESSGERFSLRDCVDFRPIKTANTALNPIDVGTYQIPTGGLRFPKPNSSFIADLIYYKGRVSRIYVNSRGSFGINEGIPTTSENLRSKFSSKVPETLELAEITIPPYPSLPEDVIIKILKNRRFTMKDIGKLNDRVEKLEYFTALSYLEKESTNKIITDADGIERFKNGILVDPFTGYSVARPDSDVGYAASIDETNKYVTAQQSHAEHRFEYIRGGVTSSTQWNTGGKITLPYTNEAPANLRQVFASRQLRLTEELNFFFTGKMNITPPVDTFPEITYEKSKEIVYDDTGDADNWKALQQAWNSEVSPLTKRFIGEEERGNLTGNEFQSGTAGGQRIFSRNREIIQQTALTIIQGSQSTTDAPKSSVSGNRLVSATAALKMRQRDFVISVRGMKRNTRVYAFFNGESVTANCRQITLASGITPEILENENMNENDFLLQDPDSSGTNDFTVIKDGSTDEFYTDDKGQINLIFRVPSGRFYTGQREFKLTDSSTNNADLELTSARQFIFSTGVSATESAITINSRPYDISFVGSNTVRPPQYEVVRTVTEEVRREAIPPPPRAPDRGWGDDPVSQSFSVDQNTYPYGFYVTKIDLFFKTKSKSKNGVNVFLREISNGYPSSSIIGLNEEAFVEGDNIIASDDNNGAFLPTTFTFKNPIYLASGNEYCFVVQPVNNDPDIALWVAELGATDLVDPTQSKRIESSVMTTSGVVFTSSNNRTWSARQNLDVKFQMHIANFGTTSKEAYFRNVNITTPFYYDRFLVNFQEQQISGTSINYEVKTMNDAFVVDESFTQVKNRREFVPSVRKYYANTAQESAQSPPVKSVQIKATLSTVNPYITPYIDAAQPLSAMYSRNVINNSVSTDVAGTVTFTPANNIVVGLSTNFASDLNEGEYVLLGSEYRKIKEIANAVYMTVENNLTTSNAVNQTITIKNEEHPVGPYTSQSRYITRIVTLNDGFEASDLAVYLKVNRPPGTNIRVYGKFLNEVDTDPFDDKFYTLLSLEGNESFSLNDNNYSEEKYVIPAAQKTGGEILLNGTIQVFSANNVVLGTATRFIEELKIGNIIGIGTARTEKVVSTIANNTFLTVDTASGSPASGQTFFKILNNEFTYVTPDSRTFSGFKQFAIKIVFLSSSPHLSPKVKELRAIALA
jgi:hypothetical protein